MRLLKATSVVAVSVCLTFWLEWGVCASDTEQVQLSGKVLDLETEKPLPGATVFIPELRRGDVADENGEFAIDKLRKGRYHVVCRLIGYADFKKEINLSENQKLYFHLKPEAIELSEVVVTADKQKVELTRSRQSVSTLTKRELQSQRGQTLGETLKEMPGVTVLQTGPAVSKPVVRGLHSQRILVLNAGVPQEGQQWGAEHAPEIDPFAPARIEVLKGAAGVEYGSSAMGGVVRIEPRELSKIAGFGGQFSANLFSNNRQGASSLLLEGHLPVGERWLWRLQGSFRKAGDSQTPNYVINNSGFEERDWSFTGGYLGDRLMMEFYYSHFGTELGIFRGSHVGNLTDLQRAIRRGEPIVQEDFSYDIGFPKQKISHDLVSLKGRFEFDALGSLEAQYGYQKNHRQEFDAHAPFSSQPPTRAAFDLKLFTHTLDVKFKHNPIKNIFGTIGLSGMRQGNVRGSSGFLIPNFRSYDFGAFLIENCSRGNLTLNLGARFDYRWQKVFAVPSKNIDERVHQWHNLSGVVGAIYQFAKAWSIGVNAGAAWRPPSVNELYSDGVHHGTAQFEIGDLNLQTEKSYNLDMTLRNVGKKSRLEFSVYHNFISDFIFLFPEPEPRLTIRGAFPTFSYRQADAILKGLDASFDYQLTDFLRAGVRASVVRGDTRDENEPLISMPSDRLKLLSRFSLPNWGRLQESYVELSAAFVARQDRFPAGDYTDPPPGYRLFDLNLGTRFRLGKAPIDVNLSVQNVFNTAHRDYLSRFRYFIDDPGRNIALKIAAPFGGFEH